MEIDALVKASLETAIIAKFKESPEAIDALVQAALRQEVTEFGTDPKAAGYYVGNRMPYLTWLCQDTIRSIAKKAVLEHIVSLKPEIKDKVVERLSSADVVDSFTKKLLGHTTEDWRIKISFEESKS